ncbi:MAG: oligosaccharide flippase family protein [Vicinamibacterales bacterium]
MAPVSAVYDTARTLVGGAATKYVLLGVNIVLGVFLMPFTVGRLGTADYGLWMLVASMTYYFQLLDLGYGSGIVRHLADADARHDPDRVNQIASTFFFLYAGLGVLALVGIAGMVFVVVPRFPNLPSESVIKAQQLLAIMGIRIAVGFPLTVFGAVTTARQRFSLNNTVAIGVAIASALVTYGVLSAGYGLVTLVFATTVVSLLSYGLYAWTARIALPSLRISRSAFTGSIVREVTTISVYFFLIDIAVQLGFNLDNLIVGAAMGTTAVAMYAVTLRLAEYQRLLCSQVNGLLFPVFVRLTSGGQRDVLRRATIESTRFSLTLVVGVTVCLLGFGTPLVTAWMGPAFRGSILPLWVLGAAGIVLVAQGPLGSVLLGTGRHRFIAFTALAEALVNVALSLVLVRWMGLLGVALGTALPVIVLSAVVLLPAACRVIEMPVGRFLAQVARGPIVAAMPAIATCVTLRYFWPPVSLPTVLAEAAFAGIVYLAVFATAGLDRTVRAQYVAYLRHWWQSGVWRPDTRGATS